jgi:hypothetical protein
LKVNGINGWFSGPTGIYWTINKFATRGQEPNKDRVGLKKNGSKPLEPEGPAVAILIY